MEVHGRKLVGELAGIFVCLIDISIHLAIIGMFMPLYYTLCPRFLVPANGHS